MFTGIVQAVRRVVDVSRTGGVTTLSIALNDTAEGLQAGASVAINGCCLTATAVQGGTVAFDLIQETTELTNLGKLTPGSQVNVERSFRVGDEVGGHILSGHIAASVPIVALEAGEGRRVLTVEVPQEWLRYLMPKGFVALNGASLTIAELDRVAATLSVSLIPETLARTTFDTASVGDRVNLEVDSQTQAVVETVRAVLADESLLEDIRG
ncbi:MAG: riboflavin synthase subunit alpha [Gammaproteobacteria bacterium]|nr:riboflavin synthase subunit alpha [Gammaproteobacteria bacterium]